MTNTMLIVAAISVVALVVVSIAAMAHVLIWTGMVTLGVKGALALYIMEVIVFVLFIRQQSADDEVCIASGSCDGPVGVFELAITAYLSLIAGVILALNAAGLWHLYRRRATARGRRSGTLARGR